MLAANVRCIPNVLCVWADEVDVEFHLTRVASVKLRWMPRVNYVSHCAS